MQSVSGLSNEAVLQVHEALHKVHTVCYSTSNEALVRVLYAQRVSAVCGVGRALCNLARVAVSANLYCSNQASSKYAIEALKHTLVLYAEHC
jgi:hypothetical protein